jgi:hypothetical protein
MCLLYMCPHTHMSPTYLSSYSYVSYICVLILIRLLHMCPHTHTSPTYLSSYSYVCYICVLTSLSVTAPDEGKRTGSHMSAIYVSSPAYQSRHQTRASALDHASGYRRLGPKNLPRPLLPARPLAPAYVSMRQHTSAYVNMRQHTSMSARSLAPAYISMRQHTPAYVSIRLCQLVL